MGLIRCIIYWVEVELNNYNSVDSMCMVLLGMRSLMLPAFIRVKQWVVRWASSVFASAYTTSLC